MNAQQVAPLSGYSQSFGTKQAGVFEFAGPTSYVAGGQTIHASGLGWGGFDWVSTGEGISYSGTYFFRVQYLATDAAPSAQKGAVPTVSIWWYVVASGLEAGAIDLSAEIGRFFAMGV